MDNLLLEDLYHNSHRVSISGNLIFFNCKRTAETAVGERSESVLTFGRLSFKREDSAFVKATSGWASISRKRSSYVDIIKCECAVNVQTRLTTPCVLVMKKGKKEGGSCHYSLFTLASSDKLELCFEFNLPYHMHESVWILRGPTVLWGHTGGVFYTSMQSREVLQIPIQLSHTVVGELPLDRGEVFVLGLQTLCSSYQSTGQIQGCFVQNGHMFDGTTMFPCPYIFIIKCILVLSAEKMDGDGLLKSVVVAATSLQQLVYFENGIVKDMCQLPFEQPENIQLVHTGRNGSLFVISFLQDHACAVWKETFQIAAHWSDVSSVHVDDFLGCGSDQMLLIFKDQSMTGPPLNRFLLTDLCGISYDCCQDDGPPKSEPPPPENYLLTLQALKSRLQRGMSVLQELQSEVRVKERVLQQAVQALTDFVLEREPTIPQPEQEGLIALWDGDDESKQDAVDDKTKDMPAVSSKPQVEKLWRHNAEDQMVVGVILTTDHSVPVASVSLSILTETGRSSTPAVIQTRSQVFWLPAPCSSSSSSSSSASMFPEPAAKRSKQHNDLNTCRLAVAAVTRLTPLLNSGCVKCCVMLHYIQRQNAFAFVSNPTPTTLHCGQFTLDIRSDFQTRLLENPKLKTDEMSENLLSLLAVLDHWVFHIDSPDHSLGDVEGWIQKRMACKRVEVSPQYLLCDSSGPTALMLLHWHQITPFQGELSVHSREFQMLQFLDSLLAHLPVSCSIHPVKGRRGQGAEAQTFSSALEKELASLRECVSLPLCGGEKDEEEKSFGHEEQPEPATEEGLQKCREVWQQDVERTRRRLSPLVDLGRYRWLTQRLSEVQLDVDLAALIDTQRTLHN